MALNNSRFHRTNCGTVTYFRASVPDTDRTFVRILESSEIPWTVGSWSAMMFGDERPGAKRIPGNES